MLRQRVAGCGSASNFEHELNPVLKPVLEHSLSSSSKNGRRYNRTIIRITIVNYATRLIKKLIISALLIALFLFVVCPVLFRTSTTIRRNLIFMNWLNVPLYRNLSRPEADFGLNCTRNYYIRTQDGVKLGMWHVLPRSRLADCDVNSDARIDPAIEFSDDRPVIYYAHGNGGARGGPHRKELYKILAYHQDLDYHVVAVDYRGYGDSDDLEPSVQDIVSDAATGYFWLLDRVDRRRITVWGHSLGTAITTYFVSSLQSVHQPSGLLLESPFNKIGDAVGDHPFAVAFRWLPYFRTFFVDPVVQSDKTNFDTESKIGEVTCPLLILHAMDDRIVPYQLGVKLYHHALRVRPSGSSTKMISFDANLNYGHKNIYTDKEVPKIVRQFAEANRLLLEHN